MILDKLFQLMAEKQASDIFISAGAPIHIKIQGNTMPVNQQVMDRHDREDRLRTDVAGADQDLRGDEEMNLSFGVPNIGNFRVNLFRQRGTIASSCATSWATSRPRFARPAAGAGEVIMEKRGLILIVGATGSGKSTTIASMLDHRNANRSGHILTVEDPIEFLFKHKKSIVNQREIGMDTKAGNQRPEKRHAPGAGLHPDRRNPRQGNHAGGHRLRPDRPPVPGHAARQQQLPRAEPDHQLLPAENRPALFLDLSVALRAIISQRLVKKPDGKRIPPAKSCSTPATSAS
jgi:twitching motility protein PilU